MARFRQIAPGLGALAAMLLLFAGCASPADSGAGPSAPVTGPATPAKPAPAKPVPVVEAKPASITGSEESSTMFDNFTAYVSAIDGQAVTAGRAGWKTPLTLKAGQRTLSVAFIRGVFTAHTDVRLTARSEAVYQLKFATDAQVFGKNSYCEFWIEDVATNEKVLAPTRVPLAKIEPVK